MPFDYSCADILRKVECPILLVANKVESETQKNQAYEALKLGYGEPLIISAEHGVGLGSLEENLSILMKKINKLLYFLYLTLIFTSCKKTDEIDLSTLQTYHHVAIPLVSAEIDVEDMLERDTGDVISTGTDGELFLVYANPPTTLNASEIIEIPDQNFNISVIIYLSSKFIYIY